MSGTRFFPDDPKIRWKHLRVQVDPGANFIVDQTYLDNVYRAMTVRGEERVSPNNLVDVLKTWVVPGEPLCCARMAQVLPFFRTLVSGRQFLSNREILCPVSLAYVPGSENNVVTCAARLGHRVKAEPTLSDGLCLLYATIVSRTLQ